MTLSSVTSAAAWRGVVRPPQFLGAANRQAGVLQRCGSFPSDRSQPSSRSSAPLTSWRSKQLRDPNAQPFLRRAERLPALRRHAVPADVPKDSVEELRPMAQYRSLKEDGLSSWGFLDDQAFALRMAAVFAVGWVPGVAIGVLIFPLQQAETGAFSIQNLVAAVLLGTFLGFCLLLGVVIRLAREWDTVNKLLQRKSYYVEYDPTRKMEYGSGSGGAYSYRRVKTKEELKRDRLLANYETEPALGRLRVYLVSVLVAAGTAAVGGLSVGGQVKQATVQDEEEEEFEPEVAALLYKDKKKCKGAGCIPGLDS